MLPTIDLPTYKVEIPSSRAKVTMRPMRVRDEKILLMAKESKNPNEIFIAVKQVVLGCIVGEIDVAKLTLYDIEYLFIKLRSISIGNEISVTYFDSDDKKEYTFTIDIDKVTVSKRKAGRIISMPDNSEIQMRDPTSSIYEAPVFQKTDATSDELFDELVVNCLELYRQGDKVTLFTEQKPEDVKKFVYDLDLKTFGKVREFIEGIPTLFHEIKYTNSLGTEKTITSTALTDFFTLG
jgi:hypothetical protein